MVRVSGKIRQLLVDAGLVDRETWDAARDQGGNVIETLVEDGKITEDSLLETLGRASSVPPVDVTRVEPDLAALESISQELCAKFGVFPLSRNGEVLTIVVSDPFDVLLIDDLRRRTGCQIRQMVSSPGMIERAIDAAFQTRKREVEELMDEVRATEDLEVSAVEEEAEGLDIASTGAGDDAPAVKLVNMILLRALKEKASDIHVEPTDKHINVRLRVDGRLSRIMTVTRVVLPALISRLKILAQLDIAERFTPQDGKFQIRYEGRQIDFRLSVLPVVGGEKAVVRVLDTGSMSLKLDSMGYESRSLEHIRQAIKSPYGMLLITGPTGSGKSTTLYSCVQEVADPSVNLTTVEDPVEYRMDGINQVNVNPKRGLTFAGALRSILRQDPDIVLVGEIRDTETAGIAIKAALTGHLVLSTLHTNDAASTITRLVDMGVDPFMVSSSLLCIGAQRLARKLCESCRIETSVPEAELLDVGYLREEIGSFQLYSPDPDGCTRCNGGYRGRFAILETLAFDDNLKRMVVEGRPVHDIKAAAVRNGMLTLRRVGLLNALRGRTSLEEILRVTLHDDISSRVETQ
jgi:type IV pilus assembly protein PilB